MDNNIKYSRRDTILSMISGFVIGLLLVPTAHVTGLFLYFDKYFIDVSIIGIIFLLIAAPIGLYIFYIVAKKWKIPTIYRLGKYSMVGLLNTVLGLGLVELVVLGPVHDLIENSKRF